MKEELQFIKTLTEVELEACETVKGWSDMLGDKFKPEYNEMIMLLQYCNLVKYLYKSEEEFTGRMRVKAKVYKYKEIARGLKEQFIKDINNRIRTLEIIRAKYNKRLVKLQVSKPYPGLGG